MSCLDQWALKMGEAEWTYIFDKKKKIILFFSTTEKSSLHCRINYDEPSQTINLHIIYERKCGKVQIPVMVNLLNCLNYDLPLGFFIIDQNTGSISFKHSTHVVGIDITKQFVDTFIRGAVSTAENHYLKIDAVIEGYSVEKALTFGKK